MLLVHIFLTQQFRFLFRIYVSDVINLSKGLVDTFSILENIIRQTTNCIEVFFLLTQSLKDID